MNAGSAENFFSRNGFPDGVRVSGTVQPQSSTHRKPVVDAAAPSVIADLTRNLNPPHIASLSWMRRSVEIAGQARNDGLAMTSLSKYIPMSMEDMVFWEFIIPLKKILL
ncbi:MAG: hypothetical protein LBH60_06960 [Prevotellaceae bacterium]|nr:hypothetical protein [Prevotellaceae bacterium]